MRDKRLFIYCAGGLGRDVLRLARQIQKQELCWSEIVFIDDNKPEPIHYGAQVWRFQRYLQERDADADEFVLAAGETAFRKALYKKISAQGCRLATLVHPGVYLDEYDTLSDGCVITEGTVLGGYASLGRCAYVNLGCLLGHNVKIGAFSTVSPGAVLSGDVTIGEGTYIGTGAIVRDEVTIGRNCIIGMGSLVTKDIPDNVVAYGSPCRVIRENTDGIVFR